MYKSLNCNTLQRCSGSFRPLSEVLFITVVKYLVSKGADMFPSPLRVPIYKLETTPIDDLMAKAFPSPLGGPICK